MRSRYSFLVTLMMLACIASAQDQSFFLHAIESNGKWGYADDNDKIIISPQFEEADYDFRDGRAMVRKDGKVGFIDGSGKTVLPFKFDQLYTTPELDYFAIACIGDKWGFIDNAGNEVVPFKYELDKENMQMNLRVDGGSSYLSKETLILLKLDGKYGALTPSNKVAMPFEYDEIHDSHMPSWPTYAVNKNGKWAVADSSGKIATAFKYDDHLGFWQNFAIMKLNKRWIFVDQTTFKDRNSIKDVSKNSSEESFEYKGKWGVLNDDGDVVVDFKYDGPVRDRVFPLCKKDDKSKENLVCKWGILDKEGKEIVPATYDQISVLYGGWYEVKKDSKVGYLDTTAKMIVPVKYDDGIYCGDMFILSLDKKEGMIDVKGKEIVPFKYDDISFCYGELKAVKLNNKTGYVDMTGKEIIPLKYDDALSGFIGGLSCVKLNRKIGYIDTKGKEVIPLKYDEVDNYYDSFSTGRDYVKMKRDGKWYMVSRDGSEEEVL